MKISVIVPTFNRLDLLLDTLTSIWRQDEPVHEIIVIDDGSTDGTVEALGKLRDIRLIRQTNSGPGAARNRGVDAAKGDVVAFLDSDDLWFPWTSRTYREVFESSQADLLFGNPRLFREDSELSDVQRNQAEPAWMSFDDYYASGDDWRWWGASSFVVRRSCLEGVRFIEFPINGEDADWVMKLGHGTRLVQITGGPTFGYREHGGSVMKDTRKTLAGAWNLVKSEKRQVYPGGGARRVDRLRILGRHLRPVILEALKAGPRDEGRKLLFATLSWHIGQRRLRFLIASFFHALRP